MTDTGLRQRIYDRLEHLPDEQLPLIEEFLAFLTFKAVPIDALGFDGSIRFLRQFESGSGDYTKERHQWLDKLTIEDIWADIKQRQNSSNREIDCDSRSN